MDEQVGALGAGLMILLAACAFYDVPGKKRRRHPLYPEIYLFHLGGPWGPFFKFDFWPDHKEVFLPADPREALRAINNRGITHLVIPDRALRPIEHRFKEPEAARDRIKQCYAYGPDGHVTGGDVLIATESLDMLSNYDAVLEIDDYLAGIRSAKNPIPLRFQSKSEEENKLMFELVNERVRNEVKKQSHTHLAARRRVDTAMAAGRLEEGFRRISIDDALSMLDKETR